MTDLEMTRLCAEAIGFKYELSDNPEDFGEYVDHEGSFRTYWPLSDDSQAMALVKKFELQILPPEPASAGRWVVSYGELGKCGDSDELNRAICECVAKMQMARSSS